MGERGKFRAPRPVNYTASVPTANQRIAMKQKTIPETYEEPKE
jgi:hypothetical protein